MHCVCFCACIENTVASFRSAGGSAQVHHAGRVGGGGNNVRQESC